MSMLTAQANHLREMAYTVERVKNDAVGKLSLSGSITLAMAAMDMRDAADTIAQLRNTCHDLQRENAKLKQLIRDYNRVPCLCDHNGVRCEYCDGDTCELYERGIALGALRAGVD